MLLLLSGVVEAGGGVLVAVTETGFLDEESMVLGANWCRRSVNCLIWSLERSLFFGGLLFEGLLLGGCPCPWYDSSYRVEEYTGLAR